MVFYYHKTKSLIILFAMIVIVFLFGCYHFVPPSDQQLSYPPYGAEETDDQGRAVLRIEDKEIHVYVVDETGTPVSQAVVEAYALSDGILVAAGSHTHFPCFKILPHSVFTEINSLNMTPKIAVVTLGMMLITAVSIAATVYDYARHPEEFPLQIRELIKVDKRIKAVCVELDANDILNFGSILLDIPGMYKGMQVFGAPAKIRGVTAIKLGFTKFKLVEKTLEFIVGEVMKSAHILNSDIIKHCFYLYESNGRNIKMPYTTVDVYRIFAESEHQLYAISPTSGGIDVLVGTIEMSDGAQPSITDIAWDDKEGVLWGASFEQLYRIHPLTGQAYPTGTGFGVDKVNALGCDCAGQLFAATYDGLFLSVDKVSGRAVVKGSYGSGFSSSGDLAVRSDGMFFGTVQSNSYMTDVLVAVDPVSGRARNIGEIGYKNVFGLFFLNDTLYGVTADGNLIRIETTTGQGTFVRKLAFSAWGAQSLSSVMK